MSRTLWGAATLLGMLGAAACGGSDATGQTTETLTVQGTVAPSARKLDNARAVAMAENGHLYWAYLDARGDFSLKLPVGQSYRVVIANQLDSVYQRAIGHVVLADSDGTSSEWLGANQSGTVDLGTLGLAPASQDPSVTHVQCGCSDDSDDDHHSDDYGTHSDDDDDDHTAKDDDKDDDDDKGGSATGSGSGSGSGGGTCNVCKDHASDSGDDDDKSLYPSKEPGDKCHDQHKGDHDQDKSGSGGGDKPCPYADGGSSGSGSGSSSSSTGSGGGSSKPSGSGCTTTSECTKSCSCVASSCQTYSP